MSAFWASGPERYENGLRTEHQRRRAELLKLMRSAQNDEERDRLQRDVEQLDHDYAERRSRMGRLLF